MSVVSSGTVVVSSGVTSTGLEIVQTGALHVLNGGLAIAVAASDGGDVVVSGGGEMLECEVSGGGKVTVLSRGYSQDVIVSDGGLYYVASGGTANRSVILSGGTQIVFAKVKATSAVVMDGGLLLVSSGGYVPTPTVSQGGAMSLSGAMANQAAVFGLVEVNAGGELNNASVRDGGQVTILSKGYADAPVVHSDGFVTISSGASVNLASVYAGGSVFLDGGSGFNTKLRGGILDVGGGAYAKNTSVFSGGQANVSSGGSVENAIVSTGGVMAVLNGGTATGVKENGGWVESEDGATVAFTSNAFSSLSLSSTSGTVHSGTTATDIEVGEGGLLAVYSGGTATGIKENGGWVEFEENTAMSFAANAVDGLVLSDGCRATVHSGTTFADVEVRSGGTVHVFEDGTLTGTMTFEQGAAVSVGAGGVVAFDLTQTSAGAAPLMNDISIIQGTPLYTLTVSVDPECGSYAYALAGGADGFDGTITIHPAGREESAKISAGEIIFIGKTSYMLGILDSVLTLTVIVPDLVPPTVSDIRASTLEPTNRDVTVTAVFSDDVELAKSLYRLGTDDEWLDYVDGVTVLENTTVHFKAVDAAGNESAPASFDVTNIDKVPPLITLTGDNETPAYRAVLTAATETGLDIFYSVDGSAWTKYIGAIEVTANGAYSFQSTDTAGNTGTAGIVFANILSPLPEDLVGTKDRVSWDPNGAPKYVVEFSTDDFKHAFRAVTATAAADMMDLPAGTYQWRVRAEDRDVWAVGNDIISDGGSAEPEVLKSNGDDYGDIFFAKTAGTWGERGYFSLAQHVGSVNDWNGTNELIFLDGKGRIQNLFFGSADPNILCLTDGENGEALFLDDVFTVLPEEIREYQARVANINEIRAGAGDDVVDLTSQRFEYTGGGMTVRGGDGDDTIWANKGGNFLFGDEGGDRLVGASGNDVIAGGSGDDSMHGGGGDDVFTFCENWGADTVRQRAFGTVTLWFASGDLSNWDAATLTYTDGENSVTVSGVRADEITLKFGDDGSEEYAKLSATGAFDAFSSQRIFEESGKGILASWGQS